MCIRDRHYFLVKFPQRPGSLKEFVLDVLGENDDIAVSYTHLDVYKRQVELAFETMVDAGIKPESAYYESLHETPLIANTIARKKLFEMNRVISDTAEYGCYLFDQACKPLLGDFMKTVDTDLVGKNYNEGKDGAVDNATLVLSLIHI